MRPRGRAAGPGSPDVLEEFFFFFFPKRRQKLGFFLKQSLPAFIINIFIFIFKAFGIFVVVLLSGHAVPHMGYQFPDQGSNSWPCRGSTES